MIKNLPAMQETQVQSLCREDPLQKGMATHSSILPGDRSLVGYSSWGSQSQTHLSDWHTQGREDAIRFAICLCFLEKELRNADGSSRKQKFCQDMTAAWTRVTIMVVVRVEEVKEFKRYSGKRDDVQHTGAEREQSIQENFWVYDLHDCIERGTIWEGSVPETSLRPFTHLIKSLKLC